MKKYLLYVTFLAASCGLLYASITGRITMNWTEALGFVTGVICVWLTVKEHIWNWPIGILNSIFYVIVFSRIKLYMDMSLQVVYIILGFVGWYWWLYGGERRTKLHVTRTSGKTALVLILCVVVGTYGLMGVSQRMGGAMPFWDSFTTALSLAAQYMLTKKLIENWYVWLTADIIYVVMYINKHLYLTSILYGLFIILCFMGLKEWRSYRQLYRKDQAQAVADAYDEAVNV